MIDLKTINKSFSKSTFLLILMFFPVLLLWPNFALGLSAGGIGIIPAYPDPDILYSDSWFIYEMELGEVKHDAVKVINYGDQPIRVKLEAVDAITTRDGAFALVSDPSRNKDVGNWITLEKPEIDLAPNEFREVSFTVTVPEDADVGDHIGGITVQQIPREEEKKEGTGLSIVLRIGARMYLRVPGEIIEELRITDMNWQVKTTEEGKRIIFPLTVENTGNVHLDPEGTITIKGIFGRELESFEWKFGTTLPHSTVTLPLEWKRKAPIFGHFTALAAIPYAEGETTTSEVSFWIIPYTFLTWLGIVIVVVIVVFVFYRRFQEIAKRRMASYTVQEDGTVTEISEKFGVRWKKIVGVNQLKEPYRVNKGQKILIPGISQEECDRIAGKVNEEKVSRPAEPVEGKISKQGKTKKTKIEIQDK